MLKRIFFLSVTAFLVAGCSYGDKLCRDVEVESVGIVKISSNLTSSPIDGGHGPNSPAIGILLDIEDVSPDLARDVVRLSLWPKHGESESASCKDKFLLKTRVISCTQNLANKEMVLLVQYKFPDVAVNYNNYELSSRRVAEMVDSYMSSCAR
ncbi:hypothetical protein PQU63_12375 [Xanthomonas protegens]|uniref:DUF3015 domain-containing protein n=1 Tax=Xanthomonas protegens TaxID=3380705 RepID=A0ABU9LDW0_9XANT